MGKIVNGILGGVSGKVAGVVGGSWKGVKYIRGYAIPANPNTAAQQTQRGKMSASVYWAKRLLTTIIQVYWNPFCSSMSGFNCFVKNNLLNAFTTADYSKLIMSAGTLEGDSLDSAEYDTATGAFTYANAGSPLGNGLGTDIAVIVVLDTEHGVAHVNDDYFAREDGGNSFNIFQGLDATKLKAYLFFRRGSGSTLEVSNSSYLTVSAA